MSNRHLRGIDLNLLVLFRDLMHTRSLSASARRLDMSQPAASNALARLRQALGDPLLVRAGQGMQPTPLAEQIAADVEEGITRLQAALERRDHFDPASGQRDFVIAMTDLGELHFLPRLLAWCREHAPGVRVQASPATGEALREGLQDGSIDLALGPFQDLPASLHRRLLFRQHCVALFSARHPFARQPPATLAAWRQARHLMVTHTASPYREIRQRMERAGIRCAGQDQVASFLAAPFIVAATDAVVTVPAKLAAHFLQPLDLRQARPPLRLPVLETHVFWHPRRQSDPGVAWLRGRLAALFAEPAAG